MIIGFMFVYLIMIINQVILNQHTQHIILSHILMGINGYMYTHYQQMRLQSNY